MALVVRVHFPKSATRHVIVKEPREKTMREIKEEVFLSVRTLKGEANEYEAFLHLPRRNAPSSTAGGGGNSGVSAGISVTVTGDGEDMTLLPAPATRDEVLSPRPGMTATTSTVLTNNVDVCWIRDHEYLPLQDGQRPRCDVELRRKYQVVKIKCYDRAKTVLFDFTAPLREWLPLVRKKFDRDDDTDLILFLSGESQPLDVMRPLFDQDRELTQGIVLCLRRADEPVDKPTPWFKHRAAISLARTTNASRDINSGKLKLVPTLSVSSITSGGSSDASSTPNSQSSIAGPLPSPTSSAVDEAAATPTPNTPMRGYLLKANSKHKWEKRWFVLDNDLLFYYKNPNDSKPADVIDVKLYLLKEGEGKKKSYAWDLILSPNAKIENDEVKKMNYSLKTESASERKEWMTSLQRIMDKSGRKNGPMPSPPPLLTASSSANLAVNKVKKNRAEMLFGRPLELAVHNPDGSQIPALIVKCINYLDSERVLGTEGIFRLSGSANLIDKYASRFDKGEDVDLSTEQDPHTVTGLLKYYFRELPEPLMTFALYEQFIAAAGLTDKALQLRFLRHLYNRLPPINRSLLNYLFSFLFRVAANADKNKMAPTNIATVFAPALLRRLDQDPVAAMADTPKINSIVVVLLQDFDHIFRNKDIDPRLTTEGTAAPCCRAQHDYEAKSSDELSFTNGTIMRVVIEDPTWPLCETKSGAFGRIPISYVQMLTPEQSQEFAMRQQIKQRTKKAIEESEEQQRELRARIEENEELEREVEELLLKKKKVELDFYMLREVLMPVMEKSIIIREEDDSRDSRRKRKNREKPQEGENDKKEEVYLADFPKYVDDFCRESENHRRALDAVGSAKDQFLTSLEMFLGAIPVPKKDKKDKYQSLRHSIEVIKEKTKAEAFTRFELSELKDDIIRDLTELQGALKYSVKRVWTEEEEEKYSPLAKALMPPSLLQNPLSARSREKIKEQAFTVPASESGKGSKKE